MRILIVEDEQRLARTVSDLLRSQGYTTDICHDGQQGLDDACSGIYDLIILDVMLPGLDGFSLLRQLRRTGSTVPVLMLTARGDVTDRVEGLNSGADYYLTKPFEREELLACLRALLRRSGEVRPDSPAFGDLELDIAGGVLRCGGKQARLSAKEFELMGQLLRNGEQIIPKETLFLKVWGYESEAESNTVEVYISFLRKKLHYLRSRVQIEAVRRMGYHLKDGGT